MHRCIILSLLLVIRFFFLFNHWLFTCLCISLPWKPSYHDIRFCSYRPPQHITLIIVLLLPDLISCSQLFRLVHFNTASRCMDIQWNWIVTIVYTLLCPNKAGCTRELSDPISVICPNRANMTVRYQVKGNLWTARLKAFIKLQITKVCETGA